MFIRYFNWQKYFLPQEFMKIMECVIIFFKTMKTRIRLGYKKNNPLAPFIKGELL